MLIPWGLLWYDVNGPMEDRVHRAATRYQEKHDAVPNICFVNWKDIEQEELFDDKSAKMMVGNIPVYAAPTVLQGHLWIGEKNAE